MREHPRRPRHDAGREIAAHEPDVVRTIRPQPLEATASRRRGTVSTHQAPLIVPLQRVSGSPAHATPPPVPAPPVRPRARGRSARSRWAHVGAGRAAGADGRPGRAGGRWAGPPTPTGLGVPPEGGVPTAPPAPVIRVAGVASRRAGAGAARTPAAFAPPSGAAGFELPHPNADTKPPDPEPSPPSTSPPSPFPEAGLAAVAAQPGGRGNIPVSWTGSWRANRYCPRSLPAGR